MFFGERKNLFELLSRTGRVVRGANHLYDLVNIGDGNEEALHQVQPLGALSEAVLRSSGDYLNTVIEIHLKEIAESESHGLTFHQGNRVDGKTFLKRGQAIQL